jgi:hypothetical protein
VRLVHVHRDRLVHCAARGRPLAEVSDRGRDCRLVDRRRSDDNDRRSLLTGERRLQAVVDLHRLEVLGERLDAGLDRVHLERGQREDHENRDRSHGREQRPGEHAVEKPAPEAPSARPAQAVEERHTGAVDTIAEPPEEGGEDRE